MFARSEFIRQAKNVLRPLRSFLNHYRTERRWKRTVRNYLEHSNPLKLVIGSGNTQYEGWLSTDLRMLDITNPADWRKYFYPNCFDRMLAEHVLEHLSADENRAALALCYEYLKPGGIFRIAVPDGHRRDPDYVAEVTPPRDGHQMLFTIESLTAMVEESGFRVRPLEYFDASGMFHAERWESADGHIMRSARYDRQIAFKRDGLNYTSLILDAIKP